MITRCCSVASLPSKLRACTAGSSLVISLADFPPEQTSFFDFSTPPRMSSSAAPLLPVPAAPSGPVTLFIQLPGSTEGMDFAGRFVYQIKDATIAKFKLDAAPHQLRLFKLGDGGRRIQLDPTQTLTDAGVVTGTTLVLEPVASAVLAEDAAGAPLPKSEAPFGWSSALASAPLGVPRTGKRTRPTDTSALYAASLAAAVPSVLDTVADLRRELDAPLIGPVVISASHVTLLTKGGAVLSLEENDGSSGVTMEEIEQLFVGAWLRPVLDGTEEVWASTADQLTGSVLAVLDRLTRALSMMANRNAVDPSGTTDARKRPDYWLLVLGALLLKAEHKRTRAELGDAKAELVSKMNGWNAVALHGLPFLPCFAVGGELLQFCAVVCTAGGTLAVEDASPAFSMNVDLDRLRIVRATCNMFRVLIALRARMPLKVPPLYTPQERANGSTITVMDDHVLKVCVPAPDGVYACLTGDGAIPCAIHVISRVVPAGGGMAHIKMKPVCVEVLPATEGELQRAVRCVLRALGSFHARGFVHRDVRWPNVLRDPANGETLLADFELAAPAGEPLPERFRSSEFLPPEARGGGPGDYNAAGDVWQVGQLVRAWANPPGSAPRSLSPAAAAFAARLAADVPALRPTADVVLADEAWMQLHPVL